MLLFAKKYDEEILPWIINGLKDAYECKDIERANAIINMELKNKDEKFIERLKNYCSTVIKDYTLQPVIRYGDSVASYTPVYIRHNNIIDICTIEELANNYGSWNPCIEEGKEEKEVCELNNIETWTEKGWTKLHRVIRHKLDSNKKMIRILTHTGLVDVTDDHSLLDANGTEISPKDCNVGTVLLHHSIDDIYIDTLQSSSYFDKIEVGKSWTFLNHVSATTIYLKVNNLGYNVLIEEENNAIRLTVIDKTEKNNTIKKIHPIDYDGYVYDLTTENHHFAAGIGNMIVHNTDSVFACFRFKEKKDELPYDESLTLFKKIINFGKELIAPFFVEDERKTFIKYYDEYYGNVSSLELPKPPDCLPMPDNNKIILSYEERIKLFLREYLYENYLSWLWLLQELINKSYDNIEIKLYDWGSYLLSKYRFTFNDLKDNRKDEVLKPLITKIESYYKCDDNKIIWYKCTADKINDLADHFLSTFNNEITKTKPELNKLIKEFMETILKEEWIFADGIHDVEATKEKKQLKREKKYNNKQLYELLVLFIENRLKLNFDKYKVEHNDKLKKFIQEDLKDYIIQPWWDIIDGKKIYKVKILYGSAPIIDKRTLDFSIELGELSGELVKSRLPFPHDLEYEKTFWPFLILTKKRYVGNKYEFNPDKFKQDYMGIVLKRRDNAPIVKELCSGVINLLMNKRDPVGAKEFVIKSLTDMFEGKYDIKYFLQSRTLKLKESYKDWTKIAHVYLAEKIAEREGSKPESGNRIEFAVIVPENEGEKKLLQGDMIETTAYIKENNIPINYMFYMKNQIMNPVLQFLKLVDKNAEEIFKNMEEKYGKVKTKTKIKVNEEDLSLENITKNKKNKL
jgi:hypothetical protein